MADKVIIISAPGKLILHGEHAVVYGKRAIAASLNLRTYLKLEHSDTDYIQVTLPDIDLDIKWSMTDIVKVFQFPFVDSIMKAVAPSDDLLIRMKDFTGLSHDDTDTKHLAAVALLYLYCCICYRDGKLRSIQGRIASSLPTSAGLGSSAAYSTCLAAGLLRLMNHIKPTNVSSQTWSDSELKLINDWSFQAEKVIHGNPSGIDNSVSCYGGALTFQSGAINRLTKVPTLHVLLFNTKVGRSTKLLVSGVRRKYDKYPTVLSPILESMEAIVDNCESLFSRIYENDSTDSAYESLQDLIKMNQQLLGVIGVSHPALENICEHAEKHNLRAKLTGAGGGGCAFALIPPGFPPGTITLMEQKMAACGYDCWQTHVGGPGVTQHSDLLITDSIPENFSK